MFASEKVGWVISPHAARHETDIYRTADGGLSWSLWDSLPEVVGGPGTPGISVVVGESALLLVPVDSDRHSDHIMFRAEGGKWERRNFPGVPPGVFVTVAFLPDMKHGWLLRDNYGDFFQTVDGGRTWKMLTSFQRFEDAGPSTPIFWSATDGSMYYNSGGGSFGLLMTRDSGATWRTVDFPVIHAQQDLKAKTQLALSPDLTMFDEASGLMAVYVYPTQGPFDPALRKVLYLTATSDGAEHWSPPKLVRLPVAAGLVFLDSQRWLAAGDRHIYFTRDAGRHWQEARGIDPGLWRGNAGIQVMQSNRRVAFLTFSAGGIEWVNVSTDGGEHWRPVSLPDVREASE